MDAVQAIVFVLVAAVVSSLVYRVLGDLIYQKGREAVRDQIIAMIDAESEGSDG